MIGGSEQMLTRSKISELQEKNMYGGKTESQNNPKTELKKEHTRIRFSEALEFCQKYISKSATNAYRRESDPVKKRNMTKEYIYEYVDFMKPIVEGIAGLQDLKQELINEITHYGPITEAMEDPKIDEIRANGPDQIFIETEGRTIIWENNFNDREHMERIISKLLGVSKVRMTPRIPMVNARTVEGYRVNATHGEISPYGNPAFVIRKFSKKTIEPEKMIANHSFSKNMYKLLTLIPKGDLSWITVGPTGSGKTTLNEVLVRQINPLSRIITIENPSEMRLVRREENMENGKIINDIMQYESVPEEDDSSPATMDQLLTNAMRQSPHWIGPGELRTPKEFATALRAAQTGHYFFTTLHAEGDKEAIFRFLTAYLMESNEPAELALRNICSAVKFIIFQQKLADGSRKVMSITEVIGSEGLNPIVNPIYQFICEDVLEDEAHQKILKIVGRHKRVGVLSEKTRQSMLKSGIKKEKFEFLTKAVIDSEEEEYDDNEYSFYS